MSTPPRNFNEWMRSVERKLAMIPSGNAALLQKVEAMIDAAPDTGGGEDPDAGEPVDTRRPTAPVELVVQTSIYTNSNGEKRGRIVLDFPPVIYATNGTPIDIDHYQLWGRDETGWDGLSEEPAWDLLALSNVSGFTVDNLAQVSTWRLRARAMGRTTATPGEWSIELVVNIEADDVPPPIPSTPVGTVQYGVHVISWDGMAAGNVDMPTDLAWVEIARGTSSSPTELTGRRFTRADSTVFTDTPYGTTFYYRTRAVDTSGNVGNWSANISLTSQPLVVTDVMDLETRLEDEAEAYRTADAAAVVQAQEAIAAQQAADEAKYRYDEAAAAAAAAAAQYGTGSSQHNAAQAVADQRLIEWQSAQSTADAEDAQAQAAADAAAATMGYSALTSAAGSHDVVTALYPPVGTGTVGQTWMQRNASGTIVAQWESDGSTWHPRTVGSEVIANLDVGKLTASAAAISTLVAQRLAAATGEFIDLRAENFSANLIQGDWIKSGAIEAVHIKTTVLTAMMVRGDVLATHLDPLRGIKIEDAGIRAYNTVGNVTFEVDSASGSVSSVGGSFTGAIFQTTSDINRGLRFDTSGIRAYNTSGSLRFQVSSSTGDVTATGGTFTGATFQTRSSMTQGMKMNGWGIIGYGGNSSYWPGKETLLIDEETGRIDMRDRLVVGGSRFLNAGNSAGVTIIPRRPDTGAVGMFINEEASTIDGTNSAGFYVNFPTSSASNLIIRAYRGGDIDMTNRVVLRSTLTGDGGQAAINLMAGGQGRDLDLFAQGAVIARGVGGGFRMDGIPGNTAGSQVRVTRASTGPWIFWIYTSSERYKDAVEPLPTDYSEALLEMEPAWYYDRRNTSDYADWLDAQVKGEEYDQDRFDTIEPIRRHPGLIAERAQEKGLTPWINYETLEDGSEVPQSLAYDTLWLPLIPVVRDSRERIEALERKVEALERRLTD